MNAINFLIYLVLGHIDVCDASALDAKGQRLS